jgi:transglutaminase-like putative cysteine protease
VLGVIGGSRLQPRLADQLSRPALIYLMTVLILSTGLLARDMPYWLSAVGLSCVGWRLLIHAGHWPFPPGWVKGLLVVAVCVGIALQYRTLSLDVYAALLSAGLSLKVLEVYHSRGAQGLLNIAVLALMTHLLYQQGFIATLLSILQAGLIIAAINAVNTDPRLLAERPLRPLRHGLITLGLSAPLLAFLFIVMPRLPPLWSMPLQKQDARVGMGEDMSPGDFSRPTRSAELAFRAGFTGDIPPQKDLYWRGTVLDEFDGRRWKNQCDCNFTWTNTGAASKSPGPEAYNVILEPHQHRWVFTLDRAQLSDARIIGNGENLFRWREKLVERTRYDVRFAESQPPARLEDKERQRYLHLPERGNPRARELGQAWRQASGDEADVVREALVLFNRSFVYTLEPPLLGPDSVDAFLFETRRGFCEHFAGSFVFLMRAAGIPARVVMGYQGGQRHEPEHYVSVRQYDAHAWAEIWQPAQGWIRIDPTAAVAPERVEAGFADVFPDSPALTGFLGLRTLTRSNILGLIHIKLDYLDYLVGRWVLDYEGDRQQSVLRRLGLSTPRGLLLAFGLGFAVTLAVFLMYQGWRERADRRADPLTSAYRRVCARYAELGWIRAVAETPGAYSGRLLTVSAPYAADFQAISQQFCASRYRGQTLPDGERAIIKKLGRLDRRLRWLTLRCRMILT